MDKFEDRSYRFGPFEAHPGSGELFKQSQRVRIQEQPFRLLIVLLEHPGELVTREEIQKRIWPEHTFVDFDSGLRVAVRKLREALGDDAESPHYVETIPKRGYRFLPTAVFSTGVASQIADAETASSSLELETSDSENREPAHSVAADTHPAPVRKRLFPGWVYMSGVLLLAGIVLLLLPRRGNTIRLTEKDSVVLADFANSTGDAVFDETLRQGMAIQLSQSPFLNLISDQRNQQTLELMGRLPDARLTPEIAREICERTGSAIVLDGSIAPLGSQYVLGLRARDCHTGAALAQEQVQATRKEDVLNALGQIASKFRTRLGESLATVEKHNTPLPDATTGSIDALKAYSEGWKVSSSKGSAASIPFFQKALEIDPKFAMAHAVLGIMHGDMGESALGVESTTRAYELQSRANDRERFFINSSYQYHVTSNLEKTQEVCEAFARTYPREIVAHVFLSVVYSTGGNYDKAVEESKRVIELEPDQMIGYSTLARYYESLDRLDDAQNTLQQAAQRKLETPDFFVQRYDIAFLKGDKAAMDREIAQSQGIPGAEDWVTHRESFVLGYAGRLFDAREKSRRAEDMALQSGQRERAALYETAAALREGFFGNAAGAKRNALGARTLSDGREVEYGAALALALAGDAAHAQALANDLEKRFPEDTVVKSSYLPAIRGALALDHGDGAKAIEVLEVAVPNDLGSPRSTFHGGFGALYPAYMRGVAYLRLGKGKEAVAEFQKITGHRGIVLSDPIGALAYLQIGRAYALTGDQPQARHAYESFFSLWKDADSSIPILKAVRSEYQKIK